MPGQLLACSLTCSTLSKNLGTSPALSPNFLKLGMALSMSSKVRGLWKCR